MKQYNPTSPSRRSMTVVPYKKSLTTKKAFKPLVKRLQRHAGRNSQGRVTMRHQGGGNKILYRTIDFNGRAFMGIEGVVQTIEYDPYRTAFIALVRYRNGAYAYVLSPNGLKVGDKVCTGNEVALTTGNRTFLKRIPIGSFVHNVELAPQKGGQFARSAGSSVQVLAHEDGYTHLKMSSGEVRKVSWDCFATIGQVSNVEHNLEIGGKAGRSRWRGVRPTVRGSAMNPRDHPYGGGEGRQPRGTRRPKTKWGKITGGRKTRRKKKESNTFIVRRRSK